MNEFEIQLTIDDWDQDKGGFHLEKSLETSVGKALEFLFGKRSFNFTSHILARCTLPDRTPR